MSSEDTHVGDEAQKVGRRGQQGGSGIPALPLPKLATQADPLSLFPHCETKEWCCLFILTGHVHKARRGDIQPDYPALRGAPTLPLQLSSTLPPFSPPFPSSVDYQPLVFFMRAPS